MKILCLEQECYIEEDFKIFLKNNYVLKFAGPSVCQKNFDKLNISEQPEIIITKLGIYLEQHHLDENPNLKIVVTPTTGLTHINNEIINKIVLISLKQESEFLKSITSTSEHAWYLLLDLVRNNSNNFISPEDNQAIWKRENREISQLSNKSLGIIGLGRLGQILVDYAKAFRMEVYYSEKDNYILPESLKNLTRLSIEDLLNKCNYVIIAASYENYKILDKKTLENIDNPIDGLINIARGELIDEEALCFAIKRKNIKSYRTDVLTDDSNWNDKEFQNNFIFNISKHEDVKITPHIGGYAKEAIFNTRKFILKKLAIHLGLLK